MRSLFRSRKTKSASVVEPLPNAFPRIQGAEIAADFIGERVAGDFYDFLRASPERVLFGMLDVAGRRKHNRGLLLASQEVFRSSGTELFSRPDINESEALTKLTLRINCRLIEVSHGVHSCPAFIGCYHEKLGTLCYTNAGHTPGLLKDASGITELRSTGLPLGLFSHATSDAPTIGIGKGTALLLVSRGVVECGSDHDKAGEEFGFERVKSLLQTTPSGGARELCSFILGAVSQFGRGVAVSDDRTALALVRAK